MKREDVATATETISVEYVWYGPRHHDYMAWVRGYVFEDLDVRAGGDCGDAEYVRADRYAALLDREEHAEAERNAAFIGGQEEMREGAVEWCEVHSMCTSNGQSEPTHDRSIADHLGTRDRAWGSHEGVGYAVAIRALPLKDRPEQCG